jgi:hypothetical protein
LTSSATLSTIHDGRHAAAFASTPTFGAATAGADDAAGADVDEALGAGDDDGDDERHAEKTTQKAPIVAKPSRISSISTARPWASIPAARNPSYGHRVLRTVPT